LTESSPEPRERAEDRANLLAWVPLGLWAAGVLALLRAGVLLALASRRIPDATSAEIALERWNLAGRAPQLLLECAIVGLLAGALAHNAATTGRRALAAFSALLFLSTLSGWPLAPAGEIVRFQAALALDDLLVLGALAGILAVALRGLMAVALGRHPLRALVSGPVGFVLAVLVPVLGPAALAWRVAQDPPTFTLRGVQRDYLADEGWTVRARNQAMGPRLAVITPAVQQHTDSADKPALWMPPPCTVELRVRPEDGECVLRAAAGVDKSVRGRMPAGIARVTIDFRVEKNGRTVFEERVVSEAPGTADTWDPSAWVWHHVGGDEGLAVAPGDVITLYTSIPAGDPGLAVPPEALKVGYGGLVLERSIERRRTRATRDTPNIVLIVMDTLRKDHLSCYGYGRETTPNIDRLARRGTLFENALATASWTWPSTASILTGLSADAHGVTNNDSCTLNLSHATLAEVLQARGYTTAAFSCNPLIARERYFDQGFEFFEHDRGAFRMSDEVMPAVVRWIEGHAGARFFLYLHLVDPHTPHRPHPAELARLGLAPPDDFPARGMDLYTARLAQNEGESLDAVVPPAHQAWLGDLYDASVATGDRWVGVLLEALRELGLDENTVIAFTSDHGEELLDHGRLGHGHSIYSELVDVPLILAGPGIRRGVRVPGAVSNRHLAPTLARLGGAELPGMGDGRFLLADAEEHAAVVFQTAKGHWEGTRGQTLEGLRNGAWVLHWRESAGAAGVRLFHVTTDPGEQFDIAAQEAERAEAMRAELAERIGAQREYAPAHRVGVGASGLDTLIQMGYAGGDEDPKDEDR